VERGKKKKKKKEKYVYSALGGANNYKWPQAGRWDAMRGGTTAAAPRDGGRSHARTRVCTHTPAQQRAVSPHAVPPATPSPQLEEPRRPPGPFPAPKDLRSLPRADGWPGRAPHPSPAWVTARGSTRGPAADATALQSGPRGCAGARAALAAAAGAGASALRPRGPTWRRASVHRARPASRSRFAPALPYLHQQPPPAALPFAGPQRGGSQLTFPGRPAASDPTSAS